MTPPTQATTADAMSSMPVPGSTESKEENKEPVVDERLMAHDYDGIREYDNPLPSWWSLVFGACIAFSFAYFAYYNIAGWGHTPEQSYKLALAGWQSSYKGTGGPAMTEDMLAANVQNADMVSRGAQVFAARCTGCHNPDGSGQIGPNLTDLFQIHGAAKLDIYNTIINGVPGTAMVAWGEVMKPAEITSVATYVSTLRGKNLPGKEPQGNPIPASAR